MTISFALSAGNSIAITRNGNKKTLFVSARSSGNEDPSSHDAYVRLMLGPLRDLKGPWLVKSESNVRRERRKPAEPPCSLCKGTGRITCKLCKGRGRTNFVELAMLPKGEWPNWCGDCKGSGLSFCDRCLGTGEKRGMLGFHIDHDQTNNVQSSDGVS